MKVVIINCFDTYEDRVNLIHRKFMEKENEVIIIKSNYKHIKKEFIKSKDKNEVLIEVTPYQTNLSLKRIKSHKTFAEKTIEVVSSLQPDLIYVLLPPNSLAKEIANYKERYPEVKIIFDVIDLWPETLPINISKNIFPFTYWKKLRNSSISSADLIITECDYYRKILKDATIGVPTETLYLAKETLDLKVELIKELKVINLAYLGSINNIIDIKKIGKIINKIQEIKPVHLHIIGDGERKTELIDFTEKQGAKVTYYGKVYDSSIKQQIFDECHFGLNIMKPSVKVGLTMKSIDYFQHGLPIINNIPFDTKKIVEEENIGINLFEDSDYNEDFKASILNPYLFKREEVLKVFDKYFTESIFSSRIENILKINNLI